MRILALAGEPLRPPHSGYRLRCWEILSRLAARFETRLVYLDAGSDPRDAEAEQARDAPWSAVRRVRRPRASAWSLARSLASETPHHAALHDLPELREVIREQARGCDVVVAHYLYFARPLAALGAAARPLLALDQHNLDRDTWESHARAARGPLRWWLERQARLVRADERRYLPLFDGIFSVSEEDARRTREIAGDAARVVVAPNGADCERLRPVARDREGTTLLFTGTRARRNVEGLAWFLREVWPRVRAGLPRARLLVAGRIGPRDLPRSLRRETAVTFTGEAEDLTKAFQAADVGIVPVRLGGGTKLKVFEALASGVPVVALSASATGSCCGESDGVLVEGEPDAQAAVIIRLLSERDWRLRLGECGRRHAQREHDWSLVAERVGDVLEEWVAERRTAAAPPIPGASA